MYVSRYTGKVARLCLSLKFTMNYYAFLSMRDGESSFSKPVKTCKKPVKKNRKNPVKVQFFQTCKNRFLVPVKTGFSVFKKPRFSGFSGFQKTGFHSLVTIFKCV